MHIHCTNLAKLIAGNIFFLFFFPLPLKLYYLLGKSHVPLIKNELSFSARNPHLPHLTLRCAAAAARLTWPKGGRSRAVWADLARSGRISRDLGRAAGPARSARSVNTCGTRPEGAALSVICEVDASPQPVRSLSNSIGAVASLLGAWADHADRTAAHRPCRSGTPGVRNQRAGAAMLGPPGSTRGAAGSRAAPDHVRSAARAKPHDVAAARGVASPRVQSHLRPEAAAAWTRLGRDLACPQRDSRRERHNPHDVHGGLHLAS